MFDDSSVKSSVKNMKNLIGFCTNRGRVNTALYAHKSMCVCVCVRDPLIGAIHHTVL